MVAMVLMVLVSQLPVLDDVGLNEKLHSAAEYELYPVYWHDGAYRDARFNISAEPREPVGNGNGEFPWARPGGRNMDGGITRKLVWPSGVKCTRIVRKNVIGSETHRGDGRGIDEVIVDRGFDWEWPVGTVFFEVHYLKPPEAALSLPFEVRVRIKEIPGIGVETWDVNVFRPFQDSDELVRVLPDGDPLKEYLLLDRVLEKVRVEDAIHPNRAFVFEGYVDVLPDTSVDVSWLLDRPFKSCIGHWWYKDSFAPSAAGDNSIVPRGYDGYMLGNSRETCMNCHRDTGKDVTLFHLGRDWYGSIRGGDGIFSLDPVVRDGLIIKDAGPTRGVRFNTE